MQVYVNGDFVAADEARISVYDRGFMLGDGVFETWRTYGGTLCEPMIEKHLARLRRGVTYMEMDGDAIAHEIDAASRELVRLNAEEIARAGDIWLVPVISRGPGVELGAEPDEPTRVVICRPIFFAGDLYETGAHLVTSLLTRNPFGVVDPRVKTISRLGYVRGERKQRRLGPGHWVVFMDDEGYITEASGANLLIIEDGRIVRPPTWKVLNGISLDTFCELGAKLGIPIEHRPLTLYDYLNADGTYLTATSVATVPVADIDGLALRRDDDVGKRILAEWVEYVGFDFMAQARARGGVSVIS